MIYRSDGQATHLIAGDHLFSYSRTLCGVRVAGAVDVRVDGPVTCNECLRAAQAAFAWVLAHHRDDVQSKAGTAELAVPLGQIDQAGRALPVAAVKAALRVRPLPGHPVREGAGYDCHCGACEAQPGYEPRPTIPAPTLGRPGHPGWNAARVTPHDAHTEDGPADCPKCQMLRDYPLELFAAAERRLAAERGEL